MKINRYQPRKQYLVVNTRKRKPATEQRKVTEDVAETYRKEFDEVRVLLSKAYLLMSLGNEIFEEAQDVFSGINLVFDEHFKHIFRDVTESFDAICHEMNKMMSKDNHISFTNDYERVHDRLFEFVDKITSE